MSLQAKQALDLTAKIGLTKKRITQYCHYYSNQIYILDDQSQASDVLIDIIKKMGIKAEIKIQFFHTMPNKFPIQAFMTVDSPELTKEYMKKGCIKYGEESKDSYCRPLSFWTVEDVQEYFKLNSGTMNSRADREKKEVLAAVKRIAAKMGIEFKRFELDLRAPGMTIMQSLRLVRETYREETEKNEEYYAEVRNHSYCDLTKALIELFEKIDKFEISNKIKTVN